MGRSRFCWLSWWTELALIEQAAMKASRYAAGSLLTVADLTVVEVAAILTATDGIEAMGGADRVRMLAGRRIALLFYESSTRTRTSFELAAKSLGAITILVSDKSSSIEKGESLKDTGLTLRALGAECIILRHANSGAPYLLAKATGLPVLNAGDGMHEHPSQALLDLRTILAKLPGVDAGRIDGTTLAGVTVVITGDILHSRVARSNAMLLPKLGARVLLRIQRERLAGLELDLGDYVARYQLNEERLTACAPSALVMHPGPMIRG